jgi:hypothetical protein
MIKLLLDANAHLDCVDAYGDRAKDCARNFEITELLQSNEKLSLKCQCAWLIIRRSIGYKKYLPTSLINFVRMHGRE